VVTVSNSGFGQLRRCPVVLLIADESTSYAVATRVLEADGYHVLTAETGRSAIMLIATLDLPIDLVVSDLNMPDLGRQALLAELARHQRMPPVLFISGFRPPDLPGLPSPMLTNPFTPAQISAAVRQILGYPPVQEGDTSCTA
jgi:CheY-like chemotaxis protein